MGRPPCDDDVQEMYKAFIPMQCEVLADYATLLPGTKETCEMIQNEFGMKIGSTTGFNRAMVDILLENSIPQGYKPDVTVAGDDVECGMGYRPTPFMIYKNLVQLGTFPIESVLKVD